MRGQWKRLPIDSTPITERIRPLLIPKKGGFFPAFASFSLSNQLARAIEKELKISDSLFNMEAHQYAVYRAALTMFLIWEEYGLIPSDIDNWKTQIRKGYLKLCLLLIIQMMAEQILSATWETENLKGHPRKFYFLTKEGTRLLDSMKTEFKNMLEIYRELGKEK